MGPEAMKQTLNRAKGLLFEVEMALREDQEPLKAGKLFNIKELLKEFIRIEFKGVDNG